MLPKHHKTSFFLKAGIFDNLSSFAQLEKRISELPTTVDEGDAFEVFAEAYFFTQKIEQAEEVWPFKSIPSKIKENLSLGTNQQDMGVDGVFKTVSDEFNAYQAKFRTDRPSLTWREISTFMGLTDNVSQRVLFTNSNDMPSVINDRTGFHCIRGNDLDRLDKNDFETILKWLQSGDVKVEKKTPLPHQDEAIRDILVTLNDENRATALMACGTGKTLVALWVSEQIGSQNILVLLPSLTLVRQSLHEWLRETKWKHLSYLCVCSDPTVAGRELDNIVINQSDVDFAVTTDSSTVKQFLSQNTKGVKILFSTYQSAHIVTEGMDSDFRFDLGIFDEAHKTAGRKGKKFGFALKDDNLSIKKRLFLTATPRHYNINKKNEEGDFDLVYSMDNPDVYGKVTHELSFAKAARQNIICNYKVIISVVTSEQVSKELLKRGEVLINGDTVNAQLVANQIAFKEAINKYNIKRIFTFHRSVATAKSFTGKGSEGIRTQLPKFNTFHVNGTIPTAVREGIMNEFKDSDSSVISNARCLTEGVDLPAVDMVAFMSPKKSKVDIVQATGRAMRKDPHNPDKVLGYILVPLYLEITTGESIEDAVSKADFEEVWNVLQALQEQDEILAEIIRQMQEDKGRRGKYKDDGFGDKVEILGVDISLKTLQESITTVCIDKLGFTWDMRYGELIKYKEQFGDCNVPHGYVADNLKLGQWVAVQRTGYSKGQLTEDRIKRLEDIEFVWDVHESSWEEMLGALKEYKEKHGDCNVPCGWAENKKLANWLVFQRGNYRNGIISEDRIKRLEDIEFVWDVYESSWEEMLGALKEYKKKHGDCNVPYVYTENKRLGIWVHSQRMNYRRRKVLSKDQIKRLEDIDFVWDAFEAKWEEMFEALKEYKKNHGDYNIPQKYAENNKLANWVVSQRRNYRKGQLNEDQIKRLEDIGFVWKVLESNWKEMFEALKKYKKKHGNCNVPYDWAENNLKLGAWVYKRRQHYKNGNLSNDRFKCLDDIGFVWDPNELFWEEKFDALKEYKKNIGNCNVPADWSDQQIVNWARTQRTNYRKGQLSEYRIKRLEDIGFEWMSPSATKNVLSDWKENQQIVNWERTQHTNYTNKQRWEGMLEALKEYEKNYGDCNVPSGWTENKKLVNWAQTQRTNYRNKKLSDDKIKQLEDIGFVWDVHELYWEQMLDTLKEYKEKYENRKVPYVYTESKKLAQWVGNQRANYRNGKLSEDRIKRLEEIGFEW